MQTFSFNPPTNHCEEEKFFSAVTNFGATKCVFNITDEKKSFSFTTPAHWSPSGSKGAVNKLNNLFELMSPKDKELHVREVAEKNFAFADFVVSSRCKHNRNILSRP